MCTHLSKDISLYIQDSYSTKIPTARKYIHQAPGTWCARTPKKQENMNSWAYRHIDHRTGDKEAEINPTPSNVYSTPISMQHNERSLPSSPFPRHTSATNRWFNSSPKCPPSSQPVTTRQNTKILNSNYNAQYNRNRPASVPQDSVIEASAPSSRLSSLNSNAPVSQGEKPKPRREASD